MSYGELSSELAFERDQATLPAQKDEVWVEFESGMGTHTAT